MRLLIAVCFLIGALAACGGDDSKPDPQGTNVGPVEVSVSVQANTFSNPRITVTKNAHILIHFTNNDAAPHNMAFYETDAAEEEIYVGETIRGPDKSKDYEFDAPANKGTYFFRCDVHPVIMTGELIVQ